VLSGRGLPLCPGRLQEVDLLALGTWAIVCGVRELERLLERPRKLGRR